MDRVKDIFLLAVAALSLFSLVCAVYQVMNDKLASGGLLATMFLVGALVVFIPQLEVLKAWGVEAKLRESVTEARSIIERLNKLTSVYAKMSYMALAWGNRWGAPSAKDKQALLDEIDKQITEAKLSKAERDEITKPYVQLIGVDLYFIYSRVLDRYANWKAEESKRHFNANHTEEARAELQRLTNEIHAWRSNKAGKGLYERPGDFEQEVRRETPNNWLNDQEREAVQRFQREVIELFEASRKKGGFTTEAAEFYDKYHDIGGWHLKIKELFGVDLNEVK